MEKPEDINTAEYLQKALQWQKAIFEGSRDAIMISDENAMIIDANLEACKLTGYSKHELTHMRADRLNPNLDPALFDMIHQRILAGEDILGETEIFTKTGRIIDIEFGHKLITISGKSFIHSVARDITKRKELEARLLQIKTEEEEQIKHLAYYDALTGLPNRILLKDRLQHAIFNARRTGKQLAVMFLDLNRFKNINDSLGHTIGDHLIKKVAVRLRSVVRESDTVARMGGDEFIIVLPDGRQPEDALAAGNRIHKSLEKSFAVAGHFINVSTSIGISIFPSDGQTADELLKNADIAMYDCKRNHPVKYRFFTSEMNIRADQRLKIEHELRDALRNDQLILHFQPQLNTRTGALIGAEALVRWQHPAKGLLPPNEFIPIAEECDLIIDIGKLVLRKACCWNADRMQKDNQQICPVAVNIAALHIRLPEFKDHVFRALSESGLPPSLLEIELTESAFLHDTRTVLETLTILRKKGVRFAIDDFGTGYSSFNYLRRFRINKLKIDQSFIRDLPESADDAAIVTAIIQMAQSLGLEVMAEGVAAHAPMAFLRQHGCINVQGFLFGKPVPGDDFIAAWRIPRKHS